MAEPGAEQSSLSPKTQIEQDISAYREWASAASPRDLNHARRELVDNLAPINKITPQQRELYLRRLGIVTEWHTYHTFGSELRKRPELKIEVTKSTSEEDKHFHFDIGVSVCGKLYYVDLTSSQKEAQNKANLSYSPGRMNIPAYVNPRHTGVDVVVDVARALWRHMDSLQQREFISFMESPKGSTGK